MKRTIGIFVDVSRNFYAIKQSFEGRRLNYQEYLNKCLGDDYILHKAYAYGAQKDNESHTFITALKNMGYFPRYRQAKMVRNESGEKVPSIRDTSHNVAIVLDVVRNIGKLDKIVLGSNDPDLEELVHFIKERGVEVEVFSKNIPQNLWSAADSVREIDPELLDEQNE